RRTCPRHSSRQHRRRLAASQNERSASRCQDACVCRLATALVDAFSPLGAGRRSTRNDVLLRPCLLGGVDCTQGGSSSLCLPTLSGIAWETLEPFWRSGLASVPSERCPPERFNRTGTAIPDTVHLKLCWGSVLHGG
ncbi:unnamed protein product, partial [Ixodes persulcatus]